jgi:hypothetical protein
MVAIDRDTYNVYRLGNLDALDKMEQFIISMDLIS